VSEVRDPEERANPVQEMQPWQRPPFEPGNTVGRQFEPGHELSMRHGAYSPRKVDPLAGELVANIQAHVPHLAAPQWAPAVWAWARHEARAQLLTEYVMAAGERTGDGVGNLADRKVLAAYNALHRAEAAADRSRARLGLDPLSAARLGRDHVAAAVDMARFLSDVGESEGGS
jgi:hypothetical protein